jgi:mannose-6-phosphate isomerase-like protein (cupin superfamily)
MPITPYSQKINKPWGYEIVFTPKNLERVGKILFIKKGCRLSLQYHDQKEETLCLFQGKAKIWLEDKKGQIKPLYMKPQMGYTILKGQKHRLEALEDSFVFEVSSPEKGTTYRLEDDYQRRSEKLG